MRGGELAVSQRRGHSNRLLLRPRPGRNRQTIFFLLRENKSRRVQVERANKSAVKLHGTNRPLSSNPPPSTATEPFPLVARARTSFLIHLPLCFFFYPRQQTINAPLICTKKKLRNFLNFPPDRPVLFLATRSVGWERNPSGRSRVELTCSVRTSHV